MAERLREVNLKGLDEIVGIQVRMAFLLPKSLQGFVASGHHGIGVNVLARGFVQISGHSAEQCYGLARAFFAEVAKDRPGFTALACVISTKDRSLSFARHLTVVRGALVVSNGSHEPKVFEAA